MICGTLLDITVPTDKHKASTKRCIRSTQSDADLASSGRNRAQIAPHFNFVRKAMVNHVTGGHAVRIPFPRKTGLDLQLLYVHE
jgi:hypothetical protein